MQPEIAIPVGAQDDRPRTSDALQALKASGRRLGRPIEQNAETMARIAAEHADGRSLRSIAAGLTADKVPTARGGLWHASTIKRVLASVELDEQAAA